MDRLMLILSDFGDHRPRSGDSFSDKLNCSYSTFLLVLFSIMTTTKIYVGDPISCWCPAEFSDAHCDFANKVCWVTNTYSLPIEDHIPREGEPRDKIGYYQWVPLILLCQAVLFYIPRIIWQTLGKNSGIAITTITDAAVECLRKTESDARDKTMRYMVKHMSRYLHELGRRHLMSTHCKGLWWKLYGNYLSFLYLVVKLLYIANVVGQFFMLNTFLETDFSAYGFHMFRSLAEGTTWRTSDRFPRVTLCDFKVRDLGNVRRYTVQCALPVNLFNEKIYIFLWFWFFFVAFATSTSFILWSIRIIFTKYQIQFIKTQIVAMDKMDKPSEPFVEAFVVDYLQRDGVFLVRLVARNSSELIAAELVCGLWNHFKGARGGIARLKRESMQLQVEEPEAAAAVPLTSRR